MVMELIKGENAMKLTRKQKELLVAVAESMEVNFSFTECFEDCAAEDDFFNIVNENDIRKAFQGKAVSGIMSALSKKGVFMNDCAHETKWMKVRGCWMLKTIEIPLWRFWDKSTFADVYGIKQGESVYDALNRMKEELAKEAA